MEILPNWPESLGAPLNSGYQHTIETINATAMTAGISRARRVLADPVSEFSVKFLWNNEQLHQFRRFAQDQINGTAGWFVMNLWSGGGMEPHTVRILKANKYQLLAPHWSVSFVVECRDRYRLPDWVGEELLDWLPSDLVKAGEITERSLCEIGAIFKNWNNC